MVASAIESMVLSKLLLYHAERRVLADISAYLHHLLLITFLVDVNDGSLPCGTETARHSYKSVLLSAPSNKDNHTTSSERGENIIAQTFV
jgi:hypothetical protein